MMKSKTDEQIVRSVIGLAHQCQLSVVAEGVEDDATLLALLNMGCDLAQGYLIRRPMEANAASEWLGKRSLIREPFAMLNVQDEKRIALAKTSHL